MPIKIMDDAVSKNIKVGMLVAIRSGAANYYTGSAKIPSWLITDYYYTVSQVMSGGEAVTKGGKTCVLLDIKVKKLNGAEECSINTWIDKDLLLIVDTATGRAEHDLGIL